VYGNAEKMIRVRYKLKENRIPKPARMGVRAANLVFLYDEA